MSLVGIVNATIYKIANFQSSRAGRIILIFNIASTTKTNFILITMPHWKILKYNAAIFRINSLWHSGVTWRKIPWSTLIRVMFCHLLDTKSLHSQCWLIVNCTFMIKLVKFQAKYERRKSIWKWRPLNGRYIVSASKCPSIILHNRKRFTLNVRPYLIQIYCENSIVERNIKHLPCLMEWPKCYWVMKPFIRFPW